jgi:hypothetical protein
MWKKLGINTGDRREEYEDTKGIKERKIEGEG